jgi:hypothetical protein
MEAVWRGLLDLFVRLPLLLRDRASWSCDPDKAYPTTIRLTMRLVDKSLAHKRRPFVTHSKQAHVDGQELLREKDPNLLIQILKRNVSPLLNHLLQQSNAKDDIDVTRMNIALTKFQDVNATRLPSPGQASLSTHFQPKRTLELTSQASSSQGDIVPPPKKIRDSSSEDPVTSHHHVKILSHIATTNRSEPVKSESIKPPPPQKSVLSRSPVQSSKTKSSDRPGSGISSSGRPTKMKSTRIDHFFWRK